MAVENSSSGTDDDHDVRGDATRTGSSKMSNGHHSQLASAARCVVEAKTNVTSSFPKPVPRARATQAEVRGGMTSSSPGKSAHNDDVMLSSVELNNSPLLQNVSTHVLWFLFSPTPPHLSLTTHT